MSKRPKKKAVIQSKETSVKPMHNPVADWNRFVENHKLISEWYFFSPWEGITENDLHDFAMYGDVVAQAYLYSLRKAISLAENTNRALWRNHFEQLLLAHARRLNDMVCELAKSGRWAACQELWDEALKLSEAFSELALKNPTPFKSKARQSLFMPSIRAKNRKFTAHAKQIADAIELSADTVGDKLEDNRTPLGALTAQLVGECVHEIILARSVWSNLFTRYNLPVTWPTEEQIRPFLGKSLDEILAATRISTVNNKNRNSEEEIMSHLRFFCLHVDCGVERIHFLTLPGLITKWWKDGVEKMIEARFPMLLEQPNWKEELKFAKTTKAKLHELKKYCVNKVKQFAPRSSCP